MKIGVFDSGVGGLLTARSLAAALPQYSYVYLGDTARSPYGTRSEREIYAYLRQGLTFLFSQGCSLVIVACNTASAQALRKVQQQFLPKYFPGRKVLGVIIPAAEEAALAKGIRTVGVLATASTVRSRAYVRELRKFSPNLRIVQEAAPTLATLIERGEQKKSEAVLETHLRALRAKKVETVILACTHYILVKGRAREFLGETVPVISQDEIIGDKLKLYLERHPEIEGGLARGGDVKTFVTKKTKGVATLAQRWFGKRSLHLATIGP